MRKKNSPVFDLPMSDLRLARSRDDAKDVRSAALGDNSESDDGSVVAMAMVFVGGAGKGKRRNC